MRRSGVEDWEVWQDRLARVSAEGNACHIVDHLPSLVSQHRQGTQQDAHEFLMGLLNACDPGDGLEKWAPPLRATLGSTMVWDGAEGVHGGSSTSREPINCLELPLERYWD